MKNFLSSLYLLFCLQFLTAIPCLLYAQGIQALSPEEILKKRQEVFSEMVALEDPYEDSLWYQGRIYEFKIKSKTGSPYFLNTESMAGSVVFKAKVYEDIILCYNLVMDELIFVELESGGNNPPVVLNKFFVDRFTLNHDNNAYHFRLHSEKNPIHDELKEGFYEVIVDDALSMFAKHKTLLSYDATNLVYSYQYKQQLYLVSGEQIFEINKRKDFLNAFKEDKKSLRKYMKEVNIKFKRSDKQAIVDLCAYSKSLIEP